jgi:hypothetical protein
VSAASPQLRTGGANAIGFVKRSLRLLTLALSVMFSLAGCSLLKFKHKEKTPETKTQAPSGNMTLIGMVELINPEQRYVLIRCEQLLALQPGTELIALDASGARSKLVLTPERKGLFLTADIKEGSPKVSNLVMLARAGTAPAQMPATAAMPLVNPVPAAPSAANPGAGLPLEPPLPTQPIPPAPGPPSANP